jgi:hypothetical protein
MTFFKINYGNDDDNYDIIFSNNQIKKIEEFQEDIKRIFQSKLVSFLEFQKEINQSSYNWVESAIVDFIKLGYKKIDIHSIFLKYSFPDENHNLSLSIANAIKMPSQDEKIEEMLFEVSIFSEFEPGSTFSSYFLCSKNDFKKFDLEVVNYLNSNPVVYNSQIILYLESLESYMISIGYKVFNPITYQISCSYTLETLPNQWQEILGNELYSNIKNIEKSILIINKKDCKDLEEELPF